MAAAQHLIAQDPEADKNNPAHLKVGTLSYTKAGLITLFLYLLWGDFCFCLMEAVVPNILPLKLSSIGAPNVMMGLIVTSIPNLMNTVINPFASFRSDRFRSKWGRRIPFLAGATPFLVIFLILLGYSEPISRWLRTVGMGGNVSQMSILLAVIGVLMVCFQFFNLFITSVYYYLFNDVVPHAFLSRFMALFKIVGNGAGALFNFFVYKYVNTHMSEIFLGAALLYFFAFSIMCWKVKEGEYPPPPPNIGNKHGLKAAIRTYAAECFTHRFYWYFFLLNTCGAMGAVAGPYYMLAVIKLFGIDPGTYGKVVGVTGIISMSLLYPAGMIADRFHPLRVLILCSFLSFCSVPFVLTLYFGFQHFSMDHRLILWICISALSLPFSALNQAAELPMYMKLLPKERFGQFCSANAMIRSCALIIGGIGCGLFLDYTKKFNPDPNYCYRFVPLWAVTFHIGVLIFYTLLYREWKRLGGLKNYVAPQVEVMNGVAG